MEYIVAALTDGKTVLDIIKNELKFSRATLKHLKFKENGIMLNGSHVTVRAIVRTGDVLSLAVEDISTPQKLTPTELDLEIAYESELAVVPNKPANMPTHQSHGHYGDTVANALTYRYSQMGLPFVFRPVNRLDRNTSGLLLVARDRISAATLTKHMQSGRIKKRDVAILNGVLPCESGVIDTYMRRTEKSVIVREVCDKDCGGDRAITEYTVLYKSSTHTLVEAIPVTGRTHQLRVHFASLGCPIEGDDLYGAKSPLIERHALHSFLLEFPSPDDGRTVCVTAPMHEDMQHLASAVFGDDLYSIDHESVKYILPTDKEIKE